MPTVSQVASFRHFATPAGKLLLLALLCLQAGFCWTARGRSLRGEVDLRAFYTAGINVRTGHAAQLYDYDGQQQTQRALFGDHGQTLPFLYPAFAALPFALASLLPYREAFLLVLLANLGCLYLSARLLLACYPQAELSSGMLTALYLSFFPMAIALMQGQVSCLLLLIFSAFYCLLVARRPFLAGLCLALALLKFQLALPVVLLYLVWKRLRVVGGFVSGGAVLGLLSVALTGPAGAVSYLRLLRGVSARNLTNPATAKVKYGMNAADMPNLHGLAARLLHPGLAGTALLLFLSVAVLFWAGRRNASIAIALPAAMLVSYHLQPYDLVLLLLPLTVLYCEAGELLGRRFGILLLGGSVAFLMAPIAPCLLVAGETCWFALGVGGVLAGAGLLSAHRHVEGRRPSSRYLALAEHVRAMRPTTVS